MQEIVSSSERAYSFDQGRDARRRALSEVACLQLWRSGDSKVTELLMPRCCYPTVVIRLPARLCRYPVRELRKSESSILVSGSVLSLSILQVLRLHGTPSSTQSRECLWGDLRRGSVTSKSYFKLRRDFWKKKAWKMKAWKMHG